MMKRVLYNNLFFFEVQKQKITSKIKVQRCDIVAGYNNNLISDVDEPGFAGFEPNQTFFITVSNRFRTGDFEP